MALACYPVTGPSFKFRFWSKATIAFVFAGDLEKYVWCPDDCIPSLTFLSFTRSFVKKLDGNKCKDNLYFEEFAY